MKVHMISGNSHITVQMFDLRTIISCIDLYADLLVDFPQHF